MSMKIACPRCAQRYAAPDDFAGKHVKCSKCGAWMAIPRVADGSRLVPLDNSPGSLLDQELPPADLAAGRPLPAPGTIKPARSRSTRVDYVATANSLFRGLWKATRKTPARVAWLAVLAALLITVVLWLARLDRLAIPFAYACALLSNGVMIGAIIWWFCGPRPRYSWGRYIARGAMVLVCAIGPQALPPEVGRETRAAVQIVLGAVLYLYFLWEWSEMPREMRRRSWYGASIFLAGMVLCAVGILGTAGVVFNMFVDVLHGKQPAIAWQAGAGGGNGMPLPPPRVEDSPPRVAEPPLRRRANTNGERFTHAGLPDRFARYLPGRFEYRRLIVIFWIHSYHGRDEMLQAAETALSTLPWWTNDRVLDREGGYLAVGADDDSYDPAVARKALENVGFTIRDVEVH